MSAEVRVRVVESASGVPIANAHVGVFLRWSNEKEKVDLLEARTGADGIARFAIEIPEGESATVSHVVRATGRAEWHSADLRFSRRQRGGAPPTAPLPLRRGDSLDLEVSLEPGVTIAGRVTDGDDRPVRHAFIALVLSTPTTCSWPYAFSMSSRVEWPPPCWTGDDGEFEWLSFPAEFVSHVPDSRWVLTAEHDGHGPAMVSNVEAIPPDAAGVIRCDVRMPRGVGLAGVVRGPDGAPVAAARVTAIAEPTIDQPGCIRFDKVAKCGADGRFTFRGLPRRRHRVTIEAPSFAPSSTEIDLTAPRESEFVIRLERGADLDGLLIDADGLPIADADVWTAFGEPRARRRARTDAEGRFRFTGLPLAGEIEIRGPELVETVTLPAAGLTLRQPQSRDVRLRLVAEESGSPLSPGGFASLLAPGWSTIAKIETDGAVTVSHAIPGRYRILVNVPDRGPHDDAFEVLADGTVIPEEIRVPRGGRIRGRVTDRDGAPVPNARVDAHMGRANANRVVTTDADGRYEFTAVGRRALLVVTAPGYALSWREPDDTGSPEAPAIVDFPLERGSTVRGRVRRADGTPVARALVKAWIPGFEVLPFALPSALTDESGTYVLEHVPSGLYLVGTAGGSRRVASVDGREIDADVLES